MVLNRILSLPLWSLILFLLLLAIGAGEKWGAGARERGHYPPDGASWIWSSSTKTKPTKPMSFLAYRDFSLEILPAEAEIIVTADEELRLFLNGRVVGMVRNAPGEIDQVQRVTVTDQLLLGGNRLSAELRSSRGVGGFFLCLRVEGDCVVSSDSQWVTLDQWVPGVHRGWWPLAKGKPVHRWFSAPVGRWDFDIPSETALNWSDCTVGEPLEGQRLSGLAAVEGAPFGRQVYDFGTETRGILRLKGSEKGGGLNLLRVASNLSAFGEWRSEDVLPVIPLMGQRDWNSTEVLEGRYVELTGFPVKSVTFWPVKPSCGDYANPGAKEGILALGEGRSMAPMENEIRRRFESLASGASGEGS